MFCISSGKFNGKLVSGLILDSKSVLGKLLIFNLCAFRVYEICQVYFGLSVSGDSCIFIAISCPAVLISCSSMNHETHLYRTNDPIQEIDE